MIRLRQGRADDAPPLAALHARAFDRPWSAADIAAVLSDPRGFGIVAEDPDGGLVGFSLCFGQAPDFDVLIVATREDRRRRGIACAVLEETIVEARRRDGLALTLEVAVENAPARGLYQKLGFAQTGYRRNYYQSASGGASDALLLGLDLRGAVDTSEPSPHI